MKKVPRQKLALAAETIRSLTPASLGTVAGGAVVVVVTTNTSHSLIDICSTSTISVTSVSIGSSIAEG